MFGTDLVHPNNDSYVIASLLLGRVTKFSY